MVGIYKITNKINGKCYIGQSRNIERRWKRHRHTINDISSKSYNYPLYKAMRHYGEENFTYEIVELCSINSLNDREMYYIQEYQTLSPAGYNQNPGGDSFTTPKKLNNALVKQIINRLRNSRDNSEIIGKEFVVSSNMIRAINRGDIWKQENETYPIRQHLAKVISETRAIKHCIVCGKPICDKATLCSKCVHISLRTKERPEPLILAKMIVDSGFESVGREFGVSGNAIAKWCKTYNIPSTKKALTTWYYNKIGETPPMRAQKTPQQEYLAKIQKQVQQLDPDTKQVINTYPSISAAARAIGHPNNPSHISDSCKNGWLCYGYYWFFAQESNSQ